MSDEHLRIVVRRDSVRVGRLSIRFQRTLRLPETRTELPLPPSFGAFPLKRIARESALVLPMHRDEAMWIALDAPRGTSFAVQVGLGTIDAISGGRFTSKLRRSPQNYIVAPGQPWLDGVNVGSGRIRQFVARPLGRGETVEAQLAGRESVTGIRLCVWPLKAGVNARREETRAGVPGHAPLGLGAGAVVTQKVYPDPFGPESWDARRRTCLSIRIVSDDEYQRLTGKPLPPTPISAKTYAELGYPWFELEDEGAESVEPSDRLARVKSVGELARGGKTPAGEELVIDPRSVRRLRRRSRKGRGRT